MIFQGIRTSIAKKPHIFVIFQGVRTPVPPLDPHMPGLTGILLKIVANSPTEQEYEFVEGKRELMLSKSLSGSPKLSVDTLFNLSYISFIENRFLFFIKMYECML